MRVLESWLEWNVGRKPRRQEKRGQVRDADAQELLLRTLESHKAQVPFGAVERV